MCRVACDRLNSSENFFQDCFSGMTQDTSEHSFCRPKVYRQIAMTSAGRRSALSQNFIRAKGRAALCLDDLNDGTATI